MEAILAIAAAGDSVANWAQGDNTPLTYLESQAADLSEPNDLGKAIIAIRAAGGDPNEFGGVDLVALLQATYDEATATYGGPDAGTVFNQGFAMLALSVVDQSTPEAAIDWLLDHQLDDGSWSWNGDTTPNSGDSNSTALALQALVTAGDYPIVIEQGLVYLAAQQNDDGGFTYQKPSQFGTDTDANSTAYVIQALLATGETMSDWSKDGVTPVDALLALQKDNGAFQWQTPLSDDNFLATAQAIPALAGKSFVDLLAGPTEIVTEPAAETTTETTADSTPTETPSAVAPAQLPATGGLLPSIVWLMLTGFGLLAGGWSLRKRS
jgi:hypothetical protein